MRFRLINDCPSPEDIAPYHAIVLRRAKQTASSIYRGDDAAPLLHVHGKSTQREIHQQMPAISNPPGFSEHELRSDGAADSEPRGAKLPTWKCGVDSGTNDQAAKDRITEAAAHYGWEVVHPYSRGVEGHHWRFAKQPKPNSRFHAAHISVVRHMLKTK